MISTEHRPAQSTTRRGAARPEPTRAPELIHLTLGALRVYRQELTAEEIRVSYWRRILQARLDTVANGRDDRVALGRIRAVLHQHVDRSRRLAMLPVASADDSPPLPELEVLWQSSGDDQATSAALLPRLAHAEHELSAYRRSLHLRLNAATSELIWRYRDQPALALTALPLSAADR